MKFQAFKSIPPVITFLLATTLFSHVALAEKHPHPGTADARVKSIVYNENDTTTITAHYGFSSMIEFSPREEILTVSIGDTVAWTFLEVGHRLFIKPIEDEANSNMQVITTKRAYNFTLIAKKATSHRDKSLTFTLKFRYPEEERLLAEAKKRQAEAARIDYSAIVPEHSFNAEDVNMEYTYRGSELVAPRRVFDDSEFTYFAFHENTPTPAIFAVDAEGKESLVNFHTKGKYVVVQRLARQFVLRHGSDVTCVFNKSFAPDGTKTMVSHDDKKSEV